MPLDDGWLSTTRKLVHGCPLTVMLTDDSGSEPLVLSISRLNPTIVTDSKPVMIGTTGSSVSGTV